LMARVYRPISAVFTAKDRIGFLVSVAQEGVVFSQFAGLVLSQ
jgi:hypothetical protein